MLVDKSLNDRINYFSFTALMVFYNCLNYSFALKSIYWNFSEEKQKYIGQRLGLRVPLF